MKLKNNALQELYDTLVSCNLTISPYAESPIDKDFEKCDDKIQKDIDFLKCGNEILHSANMDLVNYKQKLEKDNEELHKHIDILSASEHEALSAKNALEKDLTDAKIQIHYFKHSRDDWKRRVEHAEDECKELKATLDKANADRTELQNNLDYYMKIYADVQKDYDELFEENKQIKKELHTAEEARDNLRAELEAKVKRMDEITKDRDFFFGVYHALKNDYEKLEAKYRDMKSYSNCYAEGYSDGKEEGEENLWDMLQNVNDSQPYDFDAECDGMEDVISMDLEDFLDAYKKWQEEKEKERLEHMRDYLNRFCKGRLCSKCPLHTDNFKCEGVIGFNNIPDEDLPRYYEKARGCRRYTLKDGKLFSTPNTEEVNKSITEACENFCKAVRDADIKITENLRKGCTLKATVEINKDLLEKVCGIKLDEEEHKLEYGDAVRLPWRDYDYMYIGPDNEEGTTVRMFDPKNHAISTTHIGNVRYNGGKIIIADEDDLRKIWKDKK